MKPIKVFLFILVTLFLLVGISFFFPNGKLQLSPSLIARYPSFSEIYKTKEVDTRSVEEIASFRQDSIKSALHAASKISILDSLKIFESFDLNNPARLHYARGDKSVLFRFFSEMDSLRIKDTAAHVLHYGDSQIEMDRISGFLREQFQKLWGGNGAGMVTPMPLTPGYNLSHFFSNNWTRKVPFGPLSFRASHYRYGPLCAVCSFDSSSSASVTITARDKSTKGVKKFNVLKVLYRSNVSVNVSGNRGGKTYSAVNLSNGIKMGVWKFDTFQTKASFTFSGDSMSEVYALSMESKQGVYLDNVPMRGASGTYFTTVDRPLLEESLKALNTRMVILEFGGNVMPGMNSRKTAEWYGKEMYKQIMHFKKIRPEAVVLFIGPADMLETKEGVTRSHPYLEIVIAELKKNATEAGAIYWDMYTAMGGKNSMQVWQNHKPMLGSSDGIHFTKTGANTISRMLFETINNEYNIYKLKKRLNGLNNGI